MKFQIASVVIAFACYVFADSKVEQIIWQNLEESDTTNILVAFNNVDTKTAFRRIESLQLTGRDAILNTQYYILKEYADKVQANVISMLNKFVAGGKAYVVNQLWISAELIVRNVDKEIVEKLASHPDVKSLTAEFFIPLAPVSVDESAILNQWGVDTTRASVVWDQGISGNGVSVASIDTGARYTHEALFESYRGFDVVGNLDHNYNWYDPYLISTNEPSDLHGHGTHVTGTMCGTKNGVGVAPGAKWISCRGCDLGSCSSLSLLSCGNWIACPTNIPGLVSDCTKAPHVVNNSWGSAGGQTFFDSIILAWKNAGIVAVFSAGNSGNDVCGLIGSPGDRTDVIAVASTTISNTLSDFSSAGPTLDGRRKPEIAAPGSSITSANFASDVGYISMSGTSMAAPHVTGITSLLIQQYNNLNRKYTIQDVKNALTNGAVAITPKNQNCGGIVDTVRPNNHVGSGRIDAVNSINYIKAS